MIAKEKKNLIKISENRPVSRMLEDIIGCKWSLSVLMLIREGINRPGAIERNTEGLTTKVLNERLRKLVGFGILERKVFAEIPPHVEYLLTDFGNKFTGILDAVNSLDNEINHK